MATTKEVIIEQPKESGDHTLTMTNQGKTGLTGDKKLSIKELEAENMRLKAENLRLKSEIEKSKQAEHVLEAFFKNTISSVVLMDRHYNFIRVNERYAQADSRSVSDFIGHNHFEFYPSNAKEIFDNVVRTKEIYKVSARPFLFPNHPEWGLTYWDWTLIPVLDSSGEVDLLILTLNDVTGHIRDQEKLYGSEC